MPSTFFGPYLKLDSENQPESWFVYEITDSEDLKFYTKGLNNGDRYHKVDPSSLAIPFNATEKDSNTKYTFLTNKHSEYCSIYSLSLGNAQIHQAKNLKKQTQINLNHFVEKKPPSVFSVPSPMPQYYNQKDNLADEINPSAPESSHAQAAAADIQQPFDESFIPYETSLAETGDVNADLEIYSSIVDKLESTGFNSNSLGAKILSVLQMYWHIPAADLTEEKMNFICMELLQTYPEDKRSEKDRLLYSLTEESKNTITNIRYSLLIPSQIVQTFTENEYMNTTIGQIRNTTSVIINHIYKFKNESKKPLTLNSICDDNLDVEQMSLKLASQNDSQWLAERPEAPQARRPEAPQARRPDPSQPSFFKSKTFKIGLGGFVAGASTSSITFGIIASINSGLLSAGIIGLVSPWGAIAIIAVLTALLFVTAQKVFECTQSRSHLSLPAS